MTRFGKHNYTVFGNTRRPSHPSPQLCSCEGLVQGTRFDSQTSGQEASNGAKASDVSFFEVLSNTPAACQKGESGHEQHGCLTTFG